MIFCFHKYSFNIKKSAVPIPGTLLLLRMQRPYLLSTFEQYESVYETTRRFMHTMKKDDLLF